MSFTAPKFTNSGKIAMLEALSGKELKFTKMQLGDGELSGQSLSALTSLVHPIISVPINDIKIRNGYATISAVFKNSDVDNGFYWREIGLFAQDPDDENEEVLYCVQNAGELAEYIPSANSSVIEKVVKIAAVVGDAANVSALIDDSIVLVKREEFEQHLKAKNPHGITYDLIGAAKGAHLHNVNDILGLSDSLVGCTNAIAANEESIKKNKNAIQENKIIIDSCIAVTEIPLSEFGLFADGVTGYSNDGIYKVGNRIVGTLAAENITINENTATIFDINEGYRPLIHNLMFPAYHVSGNSESPNITAGDTAFFSTDIYIFSQKNEDGVSIVVSFDYICESAVDAKESE